MMADLPRSQESKRFGLATRFTVATISLFLALASVLVFEGSREPSFGHDPNLIKTIAPTYGIPGNLTLFQAIRGKYCELQRRYFPNPSRYTFTSISTNRCSVHGLLNQCMEIGGRQYYIEKNVAAGAVVFGFSNVLSGGQWINAFEAALQKDKPEWWDPRINGFRRENLVLLRSGRRVTLVLSEATAREFEQKYPELKRERLETAQ